MAPTKFPRDIVRVDLFSPNMLHQNNSDDISLRHRPHYCHGIQTYGHQRGHDIIRLGLAPMFQHSSHFFSCPIFYGSTVFFPTVRLFFRPDFKFAIVAYQLCAKVCLHEGKGSAVYDIRGYRFTNPRTSVNNKIASVTHLPTGKPIKIPNDKLRLLHTRRREFSHYRHLFQCTVLRRRCAAFVIYLPLKISFLSRRTDGLSNDMLLFFLKKKELDNFCDLNIFYVRY